MPPRRAPTRNTQSAAPQPSTVTFAAPPQPQLPENLVILRKHWKWAAFSQFFYTFFPVFNLEEVTIDNIEDDLVNGTNVVLPRVMQRLLYTLSYDRKVTPENFQNTLRKQYYKRDPLANPIGPEPYDGSREPSLEPQTTRTATPQTSSVVDSGEVPSSGTTVAKDVDARERSSDDSEPAKQESNENVASDKANSNHAVEGEESKAGGNPASAEEGVVAETVPIQETRDWLHISMLERLDSIHLLTEWQFHNVTRIRQIMKTEDDNATWRIEPIGYDAKKNAYWLVGEKRLWIQRVPPRPPKSLKRKRPAPKANGAKARNPPAKRPRIQQSKRTSSTPARSSLRREVKKEESSDDEGSVQAKRSGRAAKTKANARLDAQAKQLAELRAQERESNGARVSGRLRGETDGTAASSSRPLGTRISSRLRGNQDEEWQKIPEEWLNANDEDDNYKPSATDKGKARATLKTGLESDDDASSLSELTASSLTESDESDGEDEEPEVEAQDSKPQLEPEVEIPEDPPLPGDFIEWETICVTLYEWEHIMERFEGATHYLERSLLRALRIIVPLITEDLRSVQKKKTLEEAVVHRKRSSRLAIRESEKEQELLVARQKAEEEEKMSRARRAEARALKEESEREKREKAREQRKIEQEAKEAEEAAREAAAAEAEAEQSEEIDIEDDRPKKKKKGRPAKSSAKQSSKAPAASKAHPNGRASVVSTPGSRTPGEDWEVDCEVCHRHGKNIDNGHPMLCCSSCSRWQHIACHNHLYAQSGRQIPNWEKVDFVCQRCRQRKYAAAQAQHSPYHTQYGAGTQVQQYGAAYGGHTQVHGSSPYARTQPSPPQQMHPQAANGYHYLPRAHNPSSYGQPAPGQRQDYGQAAQPSQVSFAHYQPQHQGYYLPPNEQHRREQEQQYMASSRMPQERPMQQPNWDRSNPQVNDQYRTPQSYGNGYNNNVPSKPYPAPQQQQHQYPPQQHLQQHVLPPPSHLDNYGNIAPSPSWAGERRMSLGSPVQPHPNMHAHAQYGQMPNGHERYRTYPQG